MKVIKRFAAAIALSALLVPMVLSQPRAPFPVKREESAATWQRDGWAAVERAKAEKIRRGKAKNVILFIGDGMGVSTLTAARILEGQMRGESGEENRLSFEEFPFSALSKTYSANQQTSDSAPTMSAIITGVKTDEGVLSVNQNIVHADYTTVKGNETKTLLESAEEAGKSTGVVSTARLTHATPGACYAHTADRDWESDADIYNRGRGDSPLAQKVKAAYDAKFPDIARQLLEFKYGDGLEVAIGGGRSKFLTKDEADPEYPTKKGERLDGRDLTKEWLSKYKNSAYVYDTAGFNAIDPKKTDHLLGLFEPSQMQFDYDRRQSGEKEPALADMTTKAIDVLSKNKKGYFLMVEGGRIDQAHHLGNAYRALTDAIAFSNAVRAAAAKVNLDETLIIVTADHSHTFNIVGYPARGNNILGLVREIGPDGELEKDYSRDEFGKPYTTLTYANGRGYTGETNLDAEGAHECCDDPRTIKPITKGRPNLLEVDTTAPDFLQEALVPMHNETHGGEDVAIFATGVNAYIIRGSMEENWIYYVMADAFRFKK